MHVNKKHYLSLILCTIFKKQCVHLFILHTFNVIDDKDTCISFQAVQHCCALTDYIYKLHQYQILIQSIEIESQGACQ